jgi:hypothetical protein
MPILTYTFNVSVSEDGKTKATLVKGQGDSAGREIELREYSLGCRLPDDREFTVQAGPSGQMFVMGRNEQASQTLMQRMGVGRKKS